MAKTIYDIIKKQNGERFARVLRDKGLLDMPDIANIVKYAGHDAADAEQLFPYLWSLKEFKDEKADTPGDPFQLLDMAGYHAFEVHNLDEQNSIKHFFRQNEELCTFRDPTRYQQNYIIHAIKHDVWRDPYAIKPSPNPERQDEYGTSVISIQIAKSGGFISIKNRYNHTVDHPDQTFHSNPDEIIHGLSASLKSYFNVDWNHTNVNIPNGFVLMNEQILRTNFEFNGHYFGDGFYTDNGNIVNIDKTKQVQIDYFMWDAQTKQLLNPSGADDDFVRVFNEITQDKKVDITGASPNQTIVVDGVPIIKLENNQIVTLALPGIEHIGDNFLYHNKSLTTLNAPNLKKVGECFLILNHELKTLDVPNLKSADANFLFSNYALTTLNAPNLETVGKNFLSENRMLTTLNAPNLTRVGNSFLLSNNTLTTLNVPNLTNVGDEFLCHNDMLTTLNVPNLTNVGDDFLCHNDMLTTLNVPNMTNVGDEFLFFNKALTTLNAPNLKSVGDSFLRRNNTLTHLDLPNLKTAGARFLCENNMITELSLPNLEIAGEQFMHENNSLTQLSLPKLRTAGDYFMRYNTVLSDVNLPNLERRGCGFLASKPTQPQITPVHQDIDATVASSAITTQPQITPVRCNTAQRLKRGIQNLFAKVQMMGNARPNHDM